MVTDIEPLRLTEAAKPALILCSLAGLCSFLGGMIGVALLRNSGEPHALRKLSFYQASVSGVLLFWALSDLLPEAAKGITGIRVIIGFLVGCLTAWAASSIIRKAQLGMAWQVTTVYTTADEVMSCGLISFACIAVHNFLEGTSICLASYQGLDKGLGLAVAIGIENVPEGVAIALPIAFATGSMTTALQFSFVAGSCEPLGALFVHLLFRRALSQELVSFSLACIAGMLVFLCVSEILPAAVKQVGLAHAAPVSMAVAIGIAGAGMMQPLLLSLSRVSQAS